MNSTTKLPPKTKITLNELRFQKLYKYDFIYDLRKQLVEITERLAEAQKMDDPEDTQWENEDALYDFFIPFCDDVLGPGLSGQFGQPGDGVDFSYMCDKCLDLIIFLKDVFEPTSQLLLEALQTKKYDNLIDKFDVAMEKLNIQVLKGGEG